MSDKSSIVIKYKKVEHHVPPGFTAEEFVDSLAASDPEATNAQLIKDGEKDGQTFYTLKVMRGDHG